MNSVAGDAGNEFTRGLEKIGHGLKTLGWLRLPVMLRAWRAQ